MFNEAFRQLQAEDVSLENKLEALRKLTSITTRAPWPRSLLLQETLRQIAAASNRTHIEAHYLDPYWQFVTSCVERRQIQAQHVAQILLCAAHMPLPTSSSEAPHLDCLVLTISEWKHRLPQKEATELLVTMLDQMPSVKPANSTRQFKVIVRFLCHAQLCTQLAETKSRNPIEALHSFVQHLLPAFSKQKLKERELGMIILRSLVHDCRMVGAKHLFAKLSQSIHLISRNASFFTSSLLLPVSAIPTDPHVLTKKSKKPLEHRAAVDSELLTQNVVLALTILTSCLKHLGQQDVQQVLQSIAMVLAGDSKTPEGRHVDLRSYYELSALPSRVLIDTVSAVSQYISSTDTPTTTQSLAFESLCATSTAAAHIPEVQQELLRIILAFDCREGLLRGKERLISRIFQARSNRSELSELLKILAPSLVFLDEQSASLFCSAQVLRTLGAAVMSLPRTHSISCLQILHSASERAHPVVFIIVAAIVEAVQFVDFDTAYPLAVSFLHLNAEKTSDDSFMAMKLYLIGTLIITKYRQSGGISLNDIKGLIKWLDHDNIEDVERVNWKVYFVTKMDALSSHGVKSEMAAERLRQILLHLHCLQENVNTSNIRGLVPVSKPEGRGSDCGDVPRGATSQQTGYQYLPQFIFGELRE